MSAILTVALVLGLGTAPAALAEEAASDPVPDRVAVVWAWRLGGPGVQAAAAEALVGTGADVQHFLSTAWDTAKAADDRAAVERMSVLSGPAVRAAATRVLADGSRQAVDDFLASGWQTSSEVDLRVRTNQILAAGGPHVREAAQQALNAETAQAYQEFLNNGVDAPLYLDLRIQVNQVLAAGGPNVRTAAQAALDAETTDALTKFLDVEWPLQATRDQETATVAQLAGIAEAASAEATRQADAAREATAQAVDAAAVAKKQAEAAKAAGEAAQGNAKAAAAAAAKAAAAAESAAAAARQALKASDAAVAAAHRAARAANQASAAAAKSGQKAAAAYKAAAAAAGNANDAAAARQAAQDAREAAAGARKAANAADAAGRAGDAANAAVLAANGAVNQAKAAADDATAAANAAKAAGADAQKALAAAAEARANAARAARAAASAAHFATVASQAAYAARDAANRAADNALAAALAAEAAADAAGQAGDAAQVATQHANAATAAAQAAVDAANQAQAVFDAARDADAERLAISAEQADQAALDAAAGEQQRKAKTAWDAEQAAQRSVEIQQLIALAGNPATEHSLAVTAARKVALALSGDEGAGEWTRAAALDALGSDDDLVLDFVRTGLGVAAGQDDRDTLTELAADGTDKMRTAANAALAGSDAAVAAFLHSRNYSGRYTEDRLLVNQVLAAAQSDGNALVASRAQDALNTDTDAAFRAFLDAGRFSALATDERLKVNQILANPASGPELKGAAQAALDGPSGYVHQFLTVGRYQAAKLDQDAATHLAEVSALLARASNAASVATQQAYEAQAAAATARGAAAEAAGYAQQAQQSAVDAARFATQAQQSAVQAQNSAASAAASAVAAANAANTARTAAKSAGRSAIWAAGSAKRAQKNALGAFAAARSARMSALAARQDAQLAIDAYNQAVATARSKVTQEQVDLNRNYCYKNYVQNSPGFVQCLNKATETADQKLQQAYINAQYCELLYPSNSPFYRNCIAQTFSPTFEASRLADFALAAGMEMAVFLTVSSVLSVAIVGGIACGASGVCGALAVMVGELVAPGTLMLFLETGGLTLTLGGLGGASAVGGLKLTGILQNAWIDDEVADAAMARLAGQLWKGCTCIDPFVGLSPGAKLDLATLAADFLQAQGRLGPEVIPTAVEHLVDGWLRYGALTREEFVLKYWDFAKNTWNWGFAAPNKGVVPGSARPVIPMEGTLWDRFGKPTGTYFSKAGVPFAQRVLPPESLSGAPTASDGWGYRIYRWEKDWDPDLGEIEESMIAGTLHGVPGYEQPGGALQFRTPLSAEELESLGFIKCLNCPPA